MCTRRERSHGAHERRRWDAHPPNASMTSLRSTKGGFLERFAGNTRKKGMKAYRVAAGEAGKNRCRSVRLWGGDWASNFFGGADLSKKKVGKGD